ncbi:MAG: TMEM165/GDT1 family protein [Nocardioidaceae bacterium]|nr:TMEM165/GDT1 family protein [Nocardioidaceae bacterium]
MNGTTWGLVVATFAACFVEMVEATTIVMAMGFTRGWRSALAGTAAALAALSLVTVAAGYALATWLPESAVQLVVGGLLLVFGMQWLRKAILRSSGRKSVHDEDAIYREEVAAAEAAERRDHGLDVFAFMVSFKGVFLEGLEVVFIVITFGLSAGDVPVAAAENALKYGVGLLLATFGTFWAVEGVGIFRAGHESVEWPGQDLAILGLLLAWWLLSRVFIRVLRRSADREAVPVR